MGAVSPVPFVNDKMMDKVVQRIVEPTMKGLIARNMDFRGFIFLGLISVNDEPFVIEYNVRMGDPETEVVLPRLKSDFGEILVKSRTKRLNEVSIEHDERVCTTVFAVSGGYPESYAKGKTMTIEAKEDVIYFHAGTKNLDSQIVTSGGRVIACSALHKTISEAINLSYSGVDSVKFEGKNFRRDIGQDLLNYTQEAK